MTANVESIPRTQVAARIKQLRIGRGMSQDDLAHQCGVTRQTVSNWETGAGGKTPRQAALRRIAEVLDTSELYLLTGRTEWPRDDDLTMEHVAVALRGASRLTEPEIAEIMKIARLYDAQHRREDEASTT